MKKHGEEHERPKHPPMQQPVRKPQPVKEEDTPHVHVWLPYLGNLGEDRLQHVCIKCGVRQDETPVTATED